MASIGTTFTKSGKKAVLCGSGELGKEVALELQRYGVEVVALDKYENAPAMHVAHRSHVLSIPLGVSMLHQASFHAFPTSLNLSLYTTTESAKSSTE